MTLQKVDLAAIRALGHDASQGTLQVLVETQQGYLMTVLPAPSQALEGLLQLAQVISEEIVSKEIQQERKITMTAVSSSNIAAIGYSETNRVLQVDFLTGKNSYRYFDVPPPVFQAFLEAPSKGGFLNSVIKRGGFEYQIE
jgi:KTSC domain